MTSASTAGHKEEVVSIVVGEEGVRFEVDRDRLTQTKSWFQSYLEGRDADARSSQILLNHEDPAQFRVFLGWLKTGSLGIKEHEVGDMTMINLFAFAQRYRVTVLQNVIIDTLFKQWKTRKTLSQGSFYKRVVPHVYATTTAGSSLRKLLTLIAMHEAPPSLFETSPEALPLEFLLDFARLVRTAAEQGKAIAGSYEEDEVRALMNTATL